MALEPSAPRGVFPKRLNLFCAPHEFRLVIALRIRSAPDRPSAPGVDIDREGASRKSGHFGYLAEKRQTIMPDLEII